MVDGDTHILFRIDRLKHRNRAPCLVIVIRSPLYTIK